MPKFYVDMRMFMSMHIEAPDEEAAIQEAEAFCEGLQPTDPYVDGWNKEREHKISHVSSIDIEDGPVDVEELEDEDA